MAESIEQKAIREAEEACLLAYNVTPREYWQFITLISQNKRVGGTKNNPIYASIRLPYMTVDGRVQMARDEHQEQNGSLDIFSEFIKVGNLTTEVTVCKATAQSTIRGMAIGHAVVNFGGGGVDSSNPIENGETSAWGRALGALGYGLFGTGIATANEVLVAMDANPIEPKQPVPDMTGKSTDSANELKEPATQAQMGKLRGMLKERGVKDGHKRELITKVLGEEPTKGQTSFSIDVLTKCDNLPKNWITEYLRMVSDANGMPSASVRDYMKNTYGTSQPVSLTKDQQVSLIEWILEPEPEEDGDVFNPGQPILPEKKLDWNALIPKICQECQITATQLSDWAITRWGNDQERDMTDLGKEAFEALLEMSYDDIKAAIAPKEDAQLSML